MNKARLSPAALVLTLAALFIPSTAGQTSVPSSPVRGEEVYAWCKHLADARFEGRLTGTEGYAAAAGWAAARFKEWGLRPLENAPGFLMPFPCSYTLIDKAELTILQAPASGTVGNAPTERKLAVRKDFIPYFFSAAGSVEAEVAFVGWGISAPELGYDDYAGLDVRGKLVICFQGAPPSRAAALTDFNRHLVRQKTARSKGAAGIFYIQSGVVGSPNGEWDPAFLPGVITTTTADLLFADRGTSAAKTQEALRTYEKPLSFAFKSKLRYKVEARRFESATGYNVVGFIPGSEPALRGEVLVVGGHLDHLGRHMGETYFGANDNASGSATILGLAKAFRERAKAPKRTILFILFGGEEMGYLGARALLDRLPPFVTKVDAMLNFDMNGVGSGLTVYITPGADALRSALAKADENARILGEVLEINTKSPSGSDYAPFVQKGIPILSFFSNNFEAKFHVPEDTIYQVNPDMMADLANEAFRTILILADR